MFGATSILPLLFLVSSVMGDNFLILHPWYSGSHIMTLHYISKNLVSREEELNDKCLKVIKCRQILGYISKFCEVLFLYVRTLFLVHSV
jgi:hypothetical protein